MRLLRLTSIPMRRRLFLHCYFWHWLCLCPWHLHPIDEEDVKNIRQTITKIVNSEAQHHLGHICSVLRKDTLLADNLSDRGSI